MCPGVFPGNARNSFSYITGKGMRLHFWHADDRGQATPGRFISVAGFDRLQLNQIVLDLGLQHIGTADLGSLEQIIRRLNGGLGVFLQSQI